jgi:tRNA-guanine family transglycosylase
MTLKYFLPWWSSDYVWKEWTVADDMTKNSAWSKAYLWDFMPNLLDGILVSRMAVTPKRVKTLRQQIRFSGTIIGDSGAHSYRALDEPPFTCQDILEFYANGEFNYGMTLDMVASPWVRSGGLTNTELEHRLQMTIANAEKCLALQARYQYPVELLGVVQGWDAESYRRCAKEILKLGFKYLAIAGQRKISLLKESILAIQQEVQQARQPIKIHVLGTGSPQMLNFYVTHGITSFDSATWFRQAWMSGTHNYFMSDGTKHTAHRATRVGLSDFEADQLSWDTTINCSCPICKTVGQQVLLFRGHERNTRRGFHNIYQYIHLLNAHRQGAGT